MSDLLEHMYLGYGVTASYNGLTVALDVDCGPAHVRFHMTPQVVEALVRFWSQRIQTRYPLPTEKGARDGKEL